MATQLYSFKITYTGCNDKIWRIAAVSSNYTLAQLGYLVLATFDTMAYHLFEMKYKNTTYFLTEEDLLCEEPEKFELLDFTKAGKLGMHTGDVIEMTYDLGCCQMFEITLLEIGDMPKGSGRAYSKYWTVPVAVLLTICHLRSLRKQSGRLIWKVIPRFIIRATALSMFLNGITEITVSI